jgi:hypothetical protein
MTDEGIKGSVQIIEPTRAERTIGRRVAETRATVPELTLGADGIALGDPGPVLWARLARTSARERRVP